MSGRGPVRVAIVGAGLMGRWHAHAVKRAGGAVAASIDPDAERAAQLAATHGARHASSLAEAASENGRAVPFDAVHICTPLGTHDSIARAAIDLGAHVLIEKPLASTGPETRDLLRYAEARGVVLCPVHQFPFQSGVRRLLAARSLIGPIVHVDVVACSAGGGGDPVAREKVAADILPHPLSLFSSILDRPVAPLAWSVQRSSSGELRASSVAGDATLSLLVSMAGRPTANTLRVIGARGTVHADLFHGFAVVERGTVSRSRKITHPFVFAGATLGVAANNLARRML
ncbi:MAG: Gfo/Idh/MocA family protein, partial [Gemmatimonadaceae bacterium]